MEPGKNQNSDPEYLVVPGETQDSDPEASVVAGETQDSDLDASVVAGETQDSDLDASVVAGETQDSDLEPSVEPGDYQNSDQPLSELRGTQKNDSLSYVELHDAQNIDQPLMAQETVAASEQPYTDGTVQLQVTCPSEHLSVAKVSEQFRPPSRPILDKLFSIHSQKSVDTVRAVSSRQSLDTGRSAGSRQSVDIEKSASSLHQLLSHCSCQMSSHVCGEERGESVAPSFRQFKRATKKMLEDYEAMFESGNVECHYYAVEHLNRNLKKMKVNKFNRLQEHRISFDPSYMSRRHDREHPFSLVHKRQARSCHGITFDHSSEEHLDKKTIKEQPPSPSVIYSNADLLPKQISLQLFPHTTPSTTAVPTAQEISALKRAIESKMEEKQLLKSRSPQDSTTRTASDIKKQLKALYRISAAHSAKRRAAKLQSLSPDSRQKSRKPALHRTKLSQGVRWTAAKEKEYVVYNNLAPSTRMFRWISIHIYIGATCWEEGAGFHKQKEKFCKNDTTISGQQAATYTDIPNRLPIKFQIRLRWLKACCIICSVRRFCKIISHLSAEKEAYLLTFIEISDKAIDSSAVHGTKYSCFECSYRRPKGDTTEIQLSTKVRVLMTHAPATRSKDEITLILCDLQCYPSFCSYPLAVQREIAQCGMFMPVGSKRVIVRQGHKAQNWYFVLSGQAVESEVVNLDGKRTPETISFVTVGMTIGEKAILQYTAQPSTVVSRRKMQLIRLEKTKFLQVFQSTANITDEVPSHIVFLRNLPFMGSFPYEMLMKHPSMCIQYYCRPNKVLVADSTHSEWIYVIRSGSCMVCMYLERTKASWQDLQLALAHPLINIDGRPCEWVWEQVAIFLCRADRVPKVNTGPGISKRQDAAYTLYQRMSAHQFEASNLNQVPALHMTRAGCKNIQHGLHLLHGGKMYCPWPLNFFPAISRTAFAIHLPSSQFPITPDHSGPTLINDAEDFPDFLTADFTSTLIQSDSHSTDLLSPSRILSARARDETSCSIDWSTAANASSLHKTSSQFPLMETSSEPFITCTGSQHVLSEQVDQTVSSRSRRKGECNVNQNVMQEVDSQASFSENEGQTRKVTKTRSQKRSVGFRDVLKEQSKASLQQLSQHKETSTHRRKQYIIPDACKPPPASPSCKKAGSPYVYTSPPVFVEIEVLKEGDHFGLDQMKEPGWDKRDQSGKVMLISRGAEVVKLHKRFFMSFASDKTLVAVRENMQLYPSQEAVQKRYRLQLAWHLYSKKVQDEFYTDLDRKRKFKGIFFDTCAFELGDPYAILKEQ